MRQMCEITKYIDTETASKLEVDLCVCCQCIFRTERKLYNEKAVLTKTQKVV